MNNSIDKCLTDYREAIIDRASATYTKIDAQLNAYDSVIEGKILIGLSKSKSEKAKQNLLECLAGLGKYDERYLAI